MYSLKAAFFAFHASVLMVVFGDSQSCVCQVDTILSKFQPFTCLNLDLTDSFLAAACKDGTISIYDINSQTVLIELSGHGDGSCTAFRFSPNMVDAVSSSDKGQLLVSAYISCRCCCCLLNLLMLKVWNTGSWTRKFSFPTFPGCIVDVCFISGDCFVSASTTGLIITWSLSQKTILRRFVIPISINHFAASRDASVFIVASGACVSLYRSCSNELLVNLVSDFDVLAAEFTPDSRWIMLIGHSEVMFRQVSGGNSSHLHRFQGGSIMALASANGKLAVLNVVLNDDEKGHAQLYESGHAGYSTLWPAKSHLQTTLSS
jgi:WD40 repeat protein